jgi:hypothetical protein
VWNGSAPTEFFRDSGAETNGSNFNSAVNNFEYTLFPGVSLLSDEHENEVTTGDLQFAPVSDVEAIVDTPTLGIAGAAVLALLLGVAGSLVLFRRLG